MGDGEAPHDYKLVQDSAKGRLFGRVDDSPTPPPPRRKRRPAPTIDHEAEQAQALRALTWQLVEPLSVDLFVSVESLHAIGIGWMDGDTLKRLRAFGAGWDADYPTGAFSFPERDADGSIVGHSLRAADGRKGAPSGCRRGLTIPDGLDLSGVVLVVEGASDTAAGVTLGIPCVGRPSNTGGVDQLAALFAGTEARPLVLGENDRKPDGQWPGRDGARHVAEALAAKLSRPVNWTMPPHDAKDLRLWLAEHDAHETEALAGGLL